MRRNKHRKNFKKHDERIIRFKEKILSKMPKKHGEEQISDSEKTRRSQKRKYKFTIIQNIM